MDELEVFRRSMEVSRRRGLSFPVAWANSFPCIGGGFEGLRLQLALTETVDAWRRSYERAPAEPGEEAAAHLVSWLVEAERDEDAGVMGAVQVG
jgi:hypothetical protein